MYYYELDNKILLSNHKYINLQVVPEEYAKNNDDYIYLLNNLNPLQSRRSFCVSDPSLIFLTEEGLNLLNISSNNDVNFPEWITTKIDSRKMISVNTNYPNWQEVLNTNFPEKWRINVVGLGDVGSTLVTGLRLLGGHGIANIGIYDLDKNKLNRLLFESNQILSTFNGERYPEVLEIQEDNIFNCDMFVFCVTAGVPPLGCSTKDVRTAQFESNCRLINIYAKKARDDNFKGIFAVVSDPVDLLCKAALTSSNMDINNKYDFKGLVPEQIHGYGLGVMNARAAYYARKNIDACHYEKCGRAFGPHGEGLVIADSIENYDNNISLYLTQKAQNANIEVRNTGFKPYIAPAFSSGSLSIIDTIKGNWHYSSTYMGNVFMGSKNKVTKSGIELERLRLPEKLLERLKTTYERLSDFI